MSNDNRCVACGRIIPEGRQICPLCEAGGDDKMKQLTIEEMRLMAGQPVYCKEEDIFGIIKIEEKGAWKNKPFLVAVWHEHGVAMNMELDIQKRGLHIYKVQSARDIPKEPISHQMGYGDFVMVCPHCKEAAIVNVFKRNPSYYPYCPWCGQKLKG